VITSHAPSLAASANVADLIVLQRQATAQRAPAVTVATPAPPAAAAPQSSTASGAAHRPAAADDADVARYETAAINITALGLSQAEQNKLNRYLNATRSAMLFSPRVMLVEGIAEALVMPPMANTLFPADSIERARFVGTVLVPIDGVDFVPYLRVLLTASGGRRIGQRIAVITDTDTQNPHRSGAGRVASLTALIAGLGASEYAAVFAGPTTLEPELLVAGNDDAVWNAWAAQQPRAWETAKAAVDAASPGGRTVAFAVELKDAGLRKGDFAQDFLDAIETAGARLRVPAYLEDALRWLTVGPIQASSS
jgi:putative ATP-dependent endonuclease of OLD family